MLGVRADARSEELIDRGSQGQEGGRQEEGRRKDHTRVTRIISNNYNRTTTKQHKRAAGGIRQVGDHSRKLDGMDVRIRRELSMRREDL